MGHILVKENNNKHIKLTNSVSMFDWQYDLQKKLQQKVKDD
jgi:hypothetical protein